MARDSPGLFNDLLEQLREEHERQIQELRLCLTRSSVSSIQSSEDSCCADPLPFREVLDPEPPPCIHPQLPPSEDPILPVSSADDLEIVEHLSQIVPVHRPYDAEPHQRQMEETMVPYYRNTEASQQTGAIARAAALSKTKTVPASHLLPGSLEDQDIAHTYSKESNFSSRASEPVKVLAEKVKPKTPGKKLRSVSFDHGSQEPSAKKEALGMRQNKFALKLGWDIESVDRSSSESRMSNLVSMHGNRKGRSSLTGDLRLSTRSRGRMSLDVSGSSCGPLDIPDKYVADPNARVHFAWDLHGTALVILDFFFVPLQAFNGDEMAFARALTWVSTIYWLIDFLRTFFLGYHDRGILVMIRRRIILHYLKTWALFDVVLLALNCSSIFFSAADWHTSATSVDCFRLLRFAKIVRVSRNISERIESERVSIIMKILKYLCSILLLCHLIACAWFAIGDATSSSEDSSWLLTYDMASADFAYRYTSSFHWALTQFTPASIAIQPTNVYERTFAIITLLCALIMFSVFVSGTTQAMVDLGNLSQNKARQFWLLRKYLSECGVPKEVSLRVQYYCGYAWESRTRSVQESSVTLLEMLSVPLRAELRTAIFEPRMAGHPLFVLIDKVAPLTMQVLCSTAVSRIMLANDDPLFHTGQLATHMYFVHMGILTYELRGQCGAESLDNSFRVSLSEEGPQGVRLSVGSWVGEAVLWVDWSYLGSLSARTECDLVALDAEQFRIATQANVHSKHEAISYAKGFVAGLNRLDQSKVSDLFESGHLEGLWFRLLNEYNVKRRGRAIMSNSTLLSATVAATISGMFRRVSESHDEDDHGES